MAIGDMKKFGRTSTRHVDYYVMESRSNILSELTVSVRIGILNDDISSL